MVSALDDTKQPQVSFKYKKYRHTERGINIMIYMSEEQQKIRESVREFTQKRVTPLAQQIDKNADIPSNLRKELAQQGYYERIVPKEYGGLGQGQVELCIQQEELGRGSASVASTVLASVLGQTPMLLYGDKEQIERFAIPIMKGEAVGAFGLTEPKHGSDFASIESTAVRDGHEYVLNGSKLYIDNTSYAQFFTIWAKTDTAVVPKHKGISAFVVERDHPGFKIDMIDDLLGLRGLGVGGFSYRNCRVPAKNRIGEEGQGFYMAMSVLERGRTPVAAMNVGIAQAALDAAKDFAMHRIQFGQPIAEFQAIQWMIADMATSVEAARLLTYNAARLIDAGGRHDREACMAKLFAVETSFQTTHKALQIHGARGCTKEWPVERMFRDARIFSIGEGTVEMQRMVIARHELQLSKGK